MNARAPQDRRPPAKKATASSQKRQQKADDEALDQGYALSDDDGTRLSVRLRDIRGTHEAALVKETGLDFMGLLETLSNRQGTDLLATALWFARLVHGRPGPSYLDLLDEVGYADFLTRDMDKPEDQEAPKASAGN